MSRPEEELLWFASDQHERLDELISAASERKETPLRRDVRSLGMILGETLAEQVSQDFLEGVESLRTYMVARREPVAQPADGGRMRGAERAVGQMSLQSAYQTAKAFALYFELINLAETNHRKRRKRAKQASGKKEYLPGSFAGTLQRMKAAGISSEATVEALRQIEIVPVFKIGRAHV